MSIGAPWRDSLAETLLPRRDRRQPPMSSQCRRKTRQQYGLGKCRRRINRGIDPSSSNSSARLSSSSAIRRSWLERGVGWVPAISRNRSARCRKKRASWREIICSLNELRCRNRGALQQVLPERRMRGEWRRNAVAGAGGEPYDPALMTPLPQLTTLDRFRLSSLDRYILRQCLSVTLFVTAALSAAVWLAQSLRLVDLIVNRGLAAEVFLYLAMLILPRFIDIVLPIGAFIAVLFVFNKLTSGIELVVMRASGLSR